MLSYLRPQNNAVKALVINFKRIFWYCQLIYFTNATLRFILKNIKDFGISATYEMRTTEHGEICISNDNQTIVEGDFKQNGKKGKGSKVAERQRERECVCASVDQNWW
jgi:hypothetical protein